MTPEVDDSDSYRSKDSDDDTIVQYRNKEDYELVSETIPKKEDSINAESSVMTSKMETQMSS